MTRAGLFSFDRKASKPGLVTSPGCNSFVYKSITHRIIKAYLVLTQALGLVFREENALGMELSFEESLWLHLNPVRGSR